MSGLQILLSLSHDFFRFNISALRSSDYHVVTGNFLYNSNKMNNRDDNNHDGCDGDDSDDNKKNNIFWKELNFAIDSLWRKLTQYIPFFLLHISLKQWLSVIKVLH